MYQTADHPQASRGDRPTNAISSIGFIGLGAMGSRIANRLLDAGHRVYATNRTAAKAQPLVERGLRLAGHPARGGSLGRRRAQHGHRR